MRRSALRFDSASNRIPAQFPQLPKSLNLDSNSAIPLLPHRKSTAAMAGTTIPPSSATLLLVQEQERRRISRELHDDLGQRLAILQIELETLETAATIPPEIVARIRELRGQVEEVSDEVERICHCLHPAMLEDLGLIPALEAHCRDFTKSSGVKTRLVRSEIPPEIPPDVVLCAYRVVQEALHNVAKHSGSKHAFVGIRGEPGWLHVLIRDTGCGFDPAKGRRGGLGLTSMEERARLTNGDYMIRSAPGRGTRIAVSLPLPERRAAHAAAGG